MNNSVLETDRRTDGRTNGQRTSARVELRFAAKKGVGSVMGEPEVLWGMEDGLIRECHCTIREQKVEGVEYFQTNEFVSN